MTRDELIKELAFAFWVPQAHENGWARDKQPTRELFEEDWSDWQETREDRKDFKLIGSMVKRAKIALTAIDAAGFKVIQIVKKDAPPFVFDDEEGHSEFLKGQSPGTIPGEGCVPGVPTENKG